MGTIFSDTLVRLRREAGFPTAYRFFHDGGGAPVLKVSYRKYLMMEQGRILPVMDKLRRLLPALHLVPATPPANELVIAWLRTLCGDEDYDSLLKPIVAARTETAGLSPMHKALNRNLAGKKYHLTPEKFRITLSSFDHFRTSMVTENETGPLTPADVARSIKVAPARAKACLDALAAGGMVKKEKDGRYRSLTAGRMIQCPDLALLDASSRAKLEDYMSRLEKGGGVEWSARALIRADALDIRGLFPLVRANVDAASAYGITEKTDNSAFFYVIGRVLRLWKF